MDETQRDEPGKRWMVADGSSRKLKDLEPDNHIVTIGIKLQRSLLARIQKAADERCIGRNLLIRTLIEQGLDRLIPIEQLTRKEEKDEDDKAGYYNDGDGVFGRYLRGGLHTPKSEPQSPGSTSSVPGGADGPDPEGFGVCLDLSCPSDGPTTEVPAPSDSDPDRRVDQSG